MAVSVTDPVTQGQPAPSLWRRRRFAVALLAALAVLLGGLVYLALGVDVGGGSPTGTVVSYLQALARGDARTALAAGTAPKDRSLLTGAVLREQQKLAPISGIRVLDTRTGDYGAVVHVAYRVGSQQVDDHLNVIHSDGDWRLASVAVDVEITGGSALPTVTVFDKRISTRNDVFVFPGAIRFGSADASFDITPATAVFTGPDIPALLTLGSALTAQGRQNGTAAMVAALQDCARSRSLAPPRCPQHVSRPAGAVTNSWHWAVTGIDGASFSQNERSPRRFTASGTAAWTLTYQVVVKRKRLTRTLTVRTPVSGVLDFGKHPVVFTLKR